jgi:hypothetical protein
LLLLLLLLLLGREGDEEGLEEGLPPVDEVVVLFMCVFKGGGKEARGRNGKLGPTPLLFQP